MQGLLTGLVRVMLQERAATACPDSFPAFYRVHETSISGHKLLLIIHNKIASRSGTLFHLQSSNQTLRPPKPAASRIGP